ncbi:MAG TPA: Trx7/PDZ domain-containing (seleno)protein [Methylomirabilota bacterium]|nr:Trx7/PDZ domain-containing (seleno)protein [Methylomirabilota bacterium]
MITPRPFLPLLLVMLLMSAPGVWGATVKDREAAVRGDKSAMEGNAHWIYNDFHRGFAAAQLTGKPLLVVLRCVPCLACAGIDARVLEESELSPLLDQFVRVRVINANALDLSRFQFDYDLSFSTMFFNGDGTVYGRYGSWTHQKDARDETTAGFRRALESVLAIHREYPANREALEGKQGEPVDFRTPVEMPTLKDRYTRNLDWEGKVVQSCVHCHQIGDAHRTLYRDRKEPIPSRWVYPFPAPETIGLTLAADHVSRVVGVKADSIAARAGFRSGDDVVSIAGQPLVSVADVSWVLHRAPEKGAIEAVVRRGDLAERVTIELPDGWRSGADISRRVGTWAMRAMALGGMVLEDLADGERERRDIDAGRMALGVAHVGQYGEHAAAKNAGFQKEDVVVEMDGLSNRHTESELIGHLLRAREPGERVAVTVLRGERRIELELPMQ